MEKPSPCPRGGRATKRKGLYGLQRMLFWVMDKPARMLMHVLNLHAILFGLAFIMAWPEVTQTLMYQNVDELLPPAVFGWALLIAGLLCGSSVHSKRHRLLRLTSTLQATIWLFAFFSYALHGDWFLAFNVGLIWSFLTGYVAHYLEEE